MSLRRPTEIGKWQDRMILVILLNLFSCVNLVDMMDLVNIMDLLESDSGDPCDTYESGDENGTDEQNSR